MIFAKKHEKSFFGASPLFPPKLISPSILPIILKLCGVIWTLRSYLVYSDCSYVLYFTFMLYLYVWRKLSLTDKMLSEIVLNDK